MFDYTVIAPSHHIAPQGTSHPDPVRCTKVLDWPPGSLTHLTVLGRAGAGRSRPTTVICLSLTGLFKLNVELLRAAQWLMTLMTVYSRVLIRVRVRRKCEHRAGDRTRPVTTVTKNHSGQKSASAPVPKTVWRTHAREQEEHNKLFWLSVVMAIKIPLGGVVLKIKYPDSYTNLCQIQIGLSLNVLNLEVVSQKLE